MYILYTHPFSQHSRRVAAFMNMADLTYEARIVALDAAEHMSEAFRAITPDHQVPVLQANELTISESHAILRWLAAEHELFDFYPQRGAARARVEHWLDWTQCRFGTAVSAVVYNSTFAGDDRDEHALMKGRAQLEEVLPILENALHGQTWLSGSEHPSLADIAAGTNIAHLALAGAAPTTSNITRWHDRLCEFEGFRQVLPPQMATA